jgi:glycine reductase
MSGQIGEVSVFAKMPLVVLTTLKKSDGFNYTEYDFAIHRAQFRLAVYLAKAGVPVQPDETTIYEHDFVNLPKNSSLPRVGYFYQLYTPQYDHLGLSEPIFYGTECRHILPTIMNPNEVLDGGFVCYFPCKGLTTYFIQNHGMITELYSRHNKDLIFCGMIVAVAHMDPVQRDRRAMISSRLAKDILNADGIVMTKVHGGMVHMDLATTAEACGRLGVKAIPMHQGLINAGTLADNALFKSDLIPGVIYMGVTIERFPVRFQPTRFLGGTGETVLFSPDHVFMQAKDQDIVGEEFLVPGIHDHTGSRPIVAYDY